MLNCCNISDARQYYAMIALDPVSEVFALCSKPTNRNGFEACETAKLSFYTKHGLIAYIDVCEQYSSTIVKFANKLFLALYCSIC